MPALTTPSLQHGFRAPDFALKGVDGITYTLQSACGPKGLLVMFICNHCPFVQAVADKIARDADELRAHGIGSIAIMPNDADAYPQDSFENMKRFAQEHHFTFPYVIDENAGNR